MQGHIGIRPIIANSTPINNKIRIQIMPNNELQLYTTYDMRYTKPLDTNAPLSPRKMSMIYAVLFYYYFILLTTIKSIYKRQKCVQLESLLLTCSEVIICIAKDSNGWFSA